MNASASSPMPLSPFAMAPIGPGEALTARLLLGSFNGLIGSISPSCSAGLLSLFVTAVD